MKISKRRWDLSQNFGGLRFRLFAPFVLMFTSVCQVSAQFNNETIFEIELVSTYDRLTPYYPGLVNNVRMQVVLSGANRIDVSRSDRVGRLGRDVQVASRLGPNDADRMEWRVVNPSTIRGTVQMPNSVRILTIKTSGSSCSVHAENRLHPGERVFVFRRLDNGQMAEFSKPRIVSARCTVR